MWQAARCQTARLSFEPVRDRRHIPVSNKASLGILLSAASTDLLVQTSRGDRKAVANHILFRRVFVIHGESLATWSMLQKNAVTGSSEFRNG